MQRVKKTGGSLEERRRMQADGGDGDGTGRDGWCRVGGGGDGSTDPLGTL